MAASGQRCIAPACTYFQEWYKEDFLWNRWLWWGFQKICFDFHQHMGTTFGNLWLHGLLVIESKKCMAKVIEQYPFEELETSLKYTNSFCFWFFFSSLPPPPIPFRWLLAMLVSTLCSIVIWWIVCGSLLPSLLFCLDGLRT